MIYTLLGEDPYLQDHIDPVPTIHTPLHIAAAFGHVQFAKEIMRLKPSFGRKLNQNGFSPMLLALKNGQNKMGQGCLHTENNLVLVQGREGRTLHHYVAEQGHVDLLTKLLSACLQSIQDVTIQNETALHIAMKNHNFDALDFLLGGLRRVKKFRFKVTLPFDYLLKDNPSSRQVGKALLKAGALNAQSLPKNDTCNLLLVVVELVVKASFKAAPSPLEAFGHFQECNNNNNNNALNITLANTTSSINSTKINLNNTKGSSKAHQPGTLILSKNDHYGVIPIFRDWVVIESSGNKDLKHASFGHVQFAREIMRLKPSFARKLNQDGFSPMHLALQNGETKMVLGFLNCESDFVQVQGREGKTPLHYVVERGDVDLLSEFLSACPQSIQVVTIQNETDLYIVMENHMVDALDFLLG
ncbi:uncharacterized protein LOC132800791 [Ziziphus jujuba]|uniref:Uncharacterized protein LOC132800791 n=1 Tax=Ziziphus jujuba TaxID=326968 RepID=A0ABM4A2V3_ZIZJJ|nr:uncharacterized protein LOC132800791 [Ziziphus jujuba]